MIGPLARLIENYQLDKQQTENFSKKYRVLSHFCKFLKTTNFVAFEYSYSIFLKNILKNHINFIGNLLCCPGRFRRVDDTIPELEGVGVDAVALCTSCKPDTS